MNNQNSAERPALILLTCIVTLLVAGVVGWGAAKAIRYQRPQAEVMRPSEPTAATTTFSIVFSAGAEQMPWGALDVLEAAANSAREKSSGSLIITAFHESPEDADLARRRAAAVQHGLESLGIQAHLIHIAPVKSVKKISEADVNRVDINVD